MTSILIHKLRWIECAFNFQLNRFNELVLFICSNSSWRFKMKSQVHMKKKPHELCYLLQIWIYLPFDIVTFPHFFFNFPTDLIFSFRIDKNFLWESYSPMYTCQTYYFRKASSISESSCALKIPLKFVFRNYFGSMMHSNWIFRNNSDVFFEWTFFRKYL